MNKFKNLVYKTAAVATMAGFSTMNALAQGTDPKLIAPANINPNLSAPAKATDITTVTGATARLVSYANTFIGIVGVLAVIMLIYGGFLYVTAGTNEDNTKKAKNILTWAFLGVGLAVLSFVIVQISSSFFSTGT